jgi:YD repeat-containing protein
MSTLNSRQVARTVVINARGHATTNFLYQYDAAGNRTRVTDPKGYATTFTYTTAGTGWSASPTR